MKKKKIENDPDAMLMTLVPMWNQNLSSRQLHAEHYHESSPHLLQICSCVLVSSIGYKMLDKSVSVDPKLIYLGWGHEIWANYSVSVGLLSFVSFHLHMPGNKSYFCGTKKKFSWMIPESKVFRIIQRLHAFINIPKYRYIIVKWRIRIFSIIYNVWAQAENMP
jgi:hypothetical protein